VRRLKQRGGNYSIQDLPGAIKERIDSLPPDGRVIQLDNSDPYFNPPLSYNPNDKITIQGISERIYDINAALRSTLHIFDLSDPLIIKDSATFAAKISERRDPNDTSIGDIMQYSLDLENELRTLANAPLITDKNLANQNHYPLYIWFIAGPELTVPADGRRPLPLSQEAMDELIKMRII
jgi:hypothetical protein